MPLAESKFVIRCLQLSFLMIALCPLLTSAQIFVDSIPQNSSLSNLKQFSLTTLQDTTKIDSLTVIPNSVILINMETGETINEDIYQVIDNKLIWLEQPDAPKGVSITYRTFPYAFQQPINRKDTNWIGNSMTDMIIGYSVDDDVEGSAFTYNGLDYSGSFSRGISFGNNQDLVLNSDFNLQIAGDIGDEIEILAAITDNNIPLQPEGNTQQLQEFDQVFIQLKRRNSILIAGDYQLNRPKGYFLNYFKRLQGASFQTKTDLGKGTIGGRASAAVSRGQFARNQIIGQEGNQGPYKLTGANGERFIIVLAGTERIYIDGVLMIRGSEDDYVIDYNSGEVTFTANQFITKDKRITSEFSYTTDAYLRTLYGVNVDYTINKLTVYANQYAEQDGKSLNSGTSLTDLQRTTFQEAGDLASSTLFPSVDTLPQFDPNRIMYEIISDTFNGVVYDTIYSYSVDPLKAKYVLSFTQVGIGNGNYLPVLSNANGRIYEFIPPDAQGNQQGAFEPVIRLSSPERKQLYTFGANYKLGKKSSVMAEVGISNFDKNTFSEVNDDDNVGIGLKTGINHKINLSKSKKKPGYLDLFANYEFVREEFEFIENYRNVEFQRNWNVDKTVKPTEHLSKAGFNIGKTGLGNLKYEVGSLIRNNIYEGLMQEVDSKFAYKGFKAIATGSYLNVSATDGNSKFFRPKIDLSQTFKSLDNLTFGVYGEREWNKRTLVNSDTLNTNSFYYDMVKFYASTNKSERYNMSAFYSQRYDYLPDVEGFGLTTVADEANFQGIWSTTNASQLTWNLSYRNLAIEDTLLTTQKGQQTYLGRLEYLLNVKKGFIQSNTVYELGSGQQQRIEYNFIETQEGQGTHTWIDRNGDGIPQQDEFEVAIFQDQANYIRFTTYTNDFIRTDNILFSESFRINPAKIWRGEKKGSWKEWISRFSTLSAWKLNRKTLESDEVLAWNPFQLNIEDEMLLSINSGIRNILYYNRINPKFGFEIGMSSNWVRTILTTGRENRIRTEQFFKSRWNLKKTLSTNLELSHGWRRNDSEFFPTRNYDIEQYKALPSITWQPSRTVRLKSIYEYEEKRNKTGIETAFSNKVTLEFTYNKISKTEIRSRFSFANVAYNGDQNTPVSYAMLEGLKDGRNFLWNLSYSRQIAKNVNLQIGYDGRKTGDVKIVHVGSASVRATF